MGLQARVFLAWVGFLLVGTSEGAPHGSGTTPHLISQPLELVVSEGLEARLPCMVDNLDGSELVWKKNDQIIGIGDQIADEFASDFSIEKCFSGNTLVIKNVKITDEAKYSCCVSAQSEIQIYEKKNNAKKHKSLIQEETPAGKVYFARVPSFYTFPDNEKNPVTEQKQLIKHAPKSVIEFLKLLKTYQNSVLTKDDVQEFKEFMIEKRPIPNRRLLRGKHAYNSNLRESLQSANIEGIDDKNVMNKKGENNMESRS